MTRPAAARPVAAWMNGEAALREAASRAERMVAQQRTLERLTDGLRLTVLGLADGTATVAVGNASGAAKLRQIRPTLERELASAGFALQRLKIRTEVGEPRFPRPPRREKDPVPQAGLRSIEALARSVDDGPLKEALSRMAARHRRAR